MMNTSLEHSLSLDDLNKEEAKQYIGGVIFVAVLMVLGIVGNLHVLLVYTFCIRPSNHRIFILFLGIFDFITCTVGMPFIIVDLRNPLTFTMFPACKILRFITYYICSSSSLILVVIAADRYRKICVPRGRQITQRVAKLLCFIVLIFALSMSWPAPVLIGITTVHTSNPNINGSRCYTENRKHFKKYQGYFNTWLISIVTISFCVLVVLYILIWRVIIQHTPLKPSDESGKKSGSNSLPKVKLTADIVELSSVSTHSIEMNVLPGRNKETPHAENPVSCTDHSRNTGKVISNQFNRRKKTTVMFILITSVYFISYFPHLILKIISFMNKDFLLNLSFEEKLVYNTFIWCFFINNMANCFVYGCFDVRFRREIIRLYSGILCRMRH